MVKLKEFIRGYAIIKIKKEKINEVLSYFLKYNVIFKSLKSDEESTSILVSQRELSYIKKLACTDEFEIKHGGLPRYIKKYKRRLGIPVGFVMLLAINFYFSLLVWNIEINGNTNISDAYIEKILEENGLKIGAFRDSIDVEEMCSGILIKDSSFGWMNVNFRGTTAYVEVMEISNDKKKDDDNAPCNIVAKRDAYILSLEVYNGTGAVKVGTSVKAGELLISGIVDSHKKGYDLVNASGSVIGEVYEEYDISVPYKYTEKVFSGVSKIKKSLVFFGNCIKVYEKGGNVGQNCDIIESRKKLELFSELPLPIELVESVYNEYETVEVNISPEQAKDMAYRQLEDKLCEIAADGEVIRKSIDGYANDDAYVIRLCVYKSTDIAEEQKIVLAK